MNHKNKDDLPYDNFKNHELLIIHEGPDVSRYQYKQPDTGCYGFNLTTADNLIIMNGDCYTLVIEPGYGRQGLPFLRGSVKSMDYFLSKCPFRDHLTEYSWEEALRDMTDLYNEDCVPHEDWEKFNDRFNKEDGSWSDHQYRELCYDLGIEEPPTGHILTATTRMQLAGLQCFVEAYENMMVKKGAMIKMKITVDGLTAGPPK